MIITWMELKTRSDNHRENEVDTADLRHKTKPQLMIALARIIACSDSGSALPATVVVELELNNIKPPPDTIEEEH